MKKRVVALLLAMTMAIGSVACGGEVPMEDPAKDTAGNGQTEDPAENGGTEDPAGNEQAGGAASWQELVPEEGASLTYWAVNEASAKVAAEEFEKQYGVPVNVEIVGFDSISKLVLEGPAGQGADIVWGPSDQVGIGYDAGVLLEMDPVIVKAMNEELQPAAVNSVKIDDQLWGIPMSMETICLFYNKDLVETPAATMEEILEEAKAQNKPEENLLYFLFTVGGYQFYAFMTAYGYELFGADGTDPDSPGFDTPECLEALKFLATMKEGMPVNAEDAQMSEAEFMNQNFIDGKTAYMINGPWALTAFDEAGLDYGVAPLPTVGGNEPVPFAGIMNNYVSYYTEYPIAAQMFAMFMASKEGGEILYKNDARISTRIDAATLPGVKDDEHIKSFIQQFEHTNATPTVSRMSYFWEVTESTFKLVFDGKLSPEDGQKKLITDFQALVDSE